MTKDKAEKVIELAKKRCEIDKMKDKSVEKGEIYIRNNGILDCTGTITKALQITAKVNKEYYETIIRGLKHQLSCKDNEYNGNVKKIQEDFKQQISQLKEEIEELKKKLEFEESCS